MIVLGKHFLSNLMLVGRPGAYPGVENLIGAGYSLTCKGWNGLPGTNTIAFT